MSSQSDGVVDDATKDAPDKGVAEQPKSNSFEASLIELARADGLIAPAAPDKAVKEDEPTEVEDQPLPGDIPDDEKDTPETPAEGEDAEDEQDQPNKPKGEAWPESAKTRVAEEAEKRRRANERADRVEGEVAKVRARIAELEAELQQSSGPVPTPEQPLIDIQDNISLDKLERVYEALEEVDLDQLNQDGTITVPAGVGQDGKLVYRAIDPDEARLAQKRADRILRKDIPRRREYLTKRAQIDANVVDLYPDLKNSEHEFTKAVNQLTNQVLNGKAMSDPEVKFWAANAVYGMIKRSEEARASANGNGNGKEVNAIVEASKTKVAPTTPRTRTFSERRTGADIEKAQKQMESNPNDKEAQAKYVEAILSTSGSQRKALQPTPE